MNILSLDTAGSDYSVALQWNGKIFSQNVTPEARQQTQAIIPLVQSIMADAGADFKALDGFIVTTGPGSFTGVRVGLATMRGFALASDKPVTGVSSFEVAACNAKNPENYNILVALESRRSDPYVQVFSNDLTPLSDPAEPSPEKIDSIIAQYQPITITGSGVALIKGHGEKTPQRHSTAEALLHLERERHIINTAINGAPQPFYLRSADAVKSTKIREIMPDQA